MKKLILVLLGLFLTGCAGMADYTISLDNGYRIDRTSVHQIAIYGDEPIKSVDKTVFNYKYVPAKVTDIWWNEEFIVAKQIVLIKDENNEHPPEKPTVNDFSYWIIDVNNHQTLGPFNEKELEIETDKLNLTEEVSLKPISKYK